MRPFIKIEADNQDITDRIRDHFESLTITTEQGALASTLDLVLNDSEEKISFPRMRARMAVAIGYAENALVSQGDFFVNDVSWKSPPSQMTLSAKSSDMMATLKVKKTRSFDDLTIGQLVTKIAAEHGLKGKVAAEYDTTKIEHLDQTSESDMNLLTRLAKQHNAIAYPFGDSYVFMSESTPESVSGRSLGTIALKRNEISSISARYPGRAMYNSAVATWVDRESAETKEVKVGDKEPVLRLSFAFKTEEEAKQRATYALKNQTFLGSSLSLTIPGRPEVVPKSTIQLSGVKSGIDGDWMATRVTHNISSSGFTTDIEARKAIG